MIKQEISSNNSLYWISNKSIDRTIPLHWHTYYEIELVTSGVGHHICNSIENDLEEGIVFLLSPQDFHQLEFPNNTSITTKTLCFQEEMLSTSIRTLLKENPAPYVLKLPDNYYKSIYNYLVEIERAITFREHNKDMLISRLIEIIIIILAGISSYQRNTYTHNNKQRAFEELQPIIAYINSHYDEPLDRDNLAKIVHLSPSYLSNVFKKTLGITLTDYIINCRMKNAKALLKHGNESVKNTMEKVGYNSASLFYRHFYKYYGVKPSDIQNSKEIPNTKKE